MNRLIIMQIYLLQTDNMNSNVVTLKETKNIGFCS